MTARMNISLPDELKIRMDAVAEPVNWSGVAAHAYERHLDDLKTAHQEKSMAEVVERLRASRGAMAQDHDRYGEGLIDGMRWARESAEWMSLERLDGVCGDATASEWELRDDLLGRSQAALSETEPEVFWVTHAGEKNPPPRFVHGFCDGALTVFEEVKKRI